MRLPWARQASDRVCAASELATIVLGRLGSCLYARSFRSPIAGMWPGPIIVRRRPAEQGAAPSRSTDSFLSAQVRMGAVPPRGLALLQDHGPRWCLGRQGGPRVHGLLLRHDARHLVVIMSHVVAEEGRGAR